MARRCMQSACLACSTLSLSCAPPAMHAVFARCTAPMDTRCSVQVLAFLPSKMRNNMHTNAITRSHGHGAGAGICTSTCANSMQHTCARACMSAHACPCTRVPAHMPMHMHLSICLHMRLHLHVPPSLAAPAVALVFGHTADANHIYTRARPS